MRLRTHRSDVVEELLSSRRVLREDVAGHLPRVERLGRDYRIDAAIEVDVERVERMNRDVPERGLQLQSLVIGQICSHTADDRPHVSIRAVHAPHRCAPVFVRTGLDQGGELSDGTVVALREDLRPYAHRSDARGFDGAGTFCPPSLGLDRSSSAPFLDAGAARHAPGRRGGHDFGRAAGKALGHAPRPRPQPAGRSSTFRTVEGCHVLHPGNAPGVSPGR